MNQHQFLALFVVTFLTTGCTSTGVVQMDRDSYLIGKKDGSPGLGVSLSNKAAVYAEANEFCRSKALEVQTLQVTTTPAALARLGSTELHFKCVMPGEMSQPLLRESDRVIEIRHR